MNNAIRSRLSLRLLLAALCLLPAQAATAQAPEAAAQPSSKEEYQALVAKMKKSDSSVDFARLRFLRTQLDNYTPYGPDSEDRPFKQLAAGNVAKAQTLAENVLAQNELDLESNITLARVADQRKDEATAAYHRYVAQGILDSVLRSGDGKTPETAYKVIAVPEEYAALSNLGLQPGTQSLAKIEGRAYDIFEALDAEGRPAGRVYFDIEPIDKWLRKKFPD